MHTSAQWLFYEAPAPAAAEAFATAVGRGSGSVSMLGGGGLALSECERHLPKSAPQMPIETKRMTSPTTNVAISVSLTFLHHIARFSSVDCFLKRKACARRGRDVGGEWNARVSRVREGEREGGWRCVNVRVCVRERQRWEGRGAAAGRGTGDERSGDDGRTRLLIEVLRLVNEQLNFLATLQHLLNVVHHHGAHLVDLLAHAGHAVGSGVSREEVHLPLHHAREVLVHAVSQRGLAALAVCFDPPTHDVVEEEEGHSSAEVAVGHAEEDEPPAHDVVEDVRVVHVRHLRVLGRELLQNSPRHRREVARGRRELGQHAGAARNQRVDCAAARAGSVVRRGIQEAGMGRGRAGDAWGWGASH